MGAAVRGIYQRDVSGLTRERTGHLRPSSQAIKPPKKLPKTATVKNVASFVA